MKYHIITYGCQMNKSDSERIANVLENLGFIACSESNKTDLLILNICSVRQSAVDRAISKAQSIKSKVLITGCIIQNYLEIEPKYQSNIIAEIPIMTGCNNFCSYCVVPYTRGKEISRPIKDIVCEAKKLIQNGIKEIWLLGQNVNSYKPSFTQLLKEINDIEGNFWIRFTYFKYLLCKTICS